MTNDAVANAITVFERRSDGTLESRGSVATGGMGTGTAEDSANGLILANVSGESSPTSTKGTAKFLLALNGGSESISVFRNDPDGLELVDTEPSNGDRPISITVNRVSHTCSTRPAPCAPASRGVHRPSPASRSTRRDSSRPSPARPVP